MSVTDPRFLDVGVVDEKQLKLLMRDWRRGRADRNVWQALSDGYVMVFSIVLVGAMVISSIVRAQQVVAVCDTDGCVAARGLLPWASVAGLLAFTLVLSRMFGPLVASAAEVFWLMDADTDRRKLLAGRLFGAIGVTVVVGALAGALVAALTGSSLAHVGIWALAGGLGAAGLVAFAAAEQGRLHARVNLALRADPAAWHAQPAEFAGLRAQVRQLSERLYGSANGGASRLSADTVKFFIDGVIENHTAALSTPYADRPDDLGLPNWQTDELREAVAAFAAAGFHLHLHAIGELPGTSTMRSRRNVQRVLVQPWPPSTYQAYYLQLWQEQ